MREFEFAEIDPDDKRWLDALSNSEHDIYHLPGYVSLEAARTHARAAAGYVSWESGALLVPYLVRQLESGLDAFDASSPYGYPGALFVGEADTVIRRSAVTRLMQGMRDLGLCSLFLRMHPILDVANDGFDSTSLHRTGDAIVVDLTQSHEDLWSGLSKDVRRVIRRSREKGLSFDVDSPDATLEEFTEIYIETMRRVEAAPVYFTFDLAYYSSLQRILGDRLHVTTVQHGGVTLCASLSSCSGGIVQSLLGGARTAALPLRPNVLETFATMERFREVGARFLNLGGGVGGRHDSLFRFKQSFSHDTRPFYSVREVLRPDVYGQLVDERARVTGVSADQLASTGFFPTYRAPA